MPEQHDENACTECGIDNPVWFAPNELWNLVMGGLDCTDDPGGFLCPVCFIRRAEAEGVVTTGWFLTTEEAAADGRWRADELAELVTWPVTVPAMYLWLRWRRYRTTCRYCRARWRDRASMLRHVSKAHSAETGEKP